MSRNYLFVDADLIVHTGEEARQRVEKTNDAQYLEGEKGVVKVPRSRWSTAQQYEKKTWMQQGAHTTDDRNEEHRAGFDDYRAIAGRKFARAIELGCGPFTNLRVLGRYAEIGRGVLLDPLTDSYLSHRHCSYRHGHVKLANSPLNARLGGWLPARAARRLIRIAWPRLLESGIPLEQRIASPIEEMPDCGTFDLVVMINVLEHCYDIERIFANVLRLARPGTVFVFHDRLYDPCEMRHELATRFDAGHPLRIAGPVITEFLEKHFESLAESRVEVVDQVQGIDLAELGIYYIGVRR